MKKKKFGTCTYIYFMNFIFECDSNKKKPNKVKVNLQVSQNAMKMSKLKKFFFIHSVW